MHHIAITTTNLEEMGKFYQKLPGLIVQQANLDISGRMRSLWFQVDHQNSVLMLERDNISKAPAAFVLSLKDTGKTEREIEEMDLNWDGRTDFTIYFRDPDGNKLGYSNYPNHWNSTLA